MGLLLSEENRGYKSCKYIINHIRLRGRKGKVTKINASFVVVDRSLCCSL